LIGLLLKLFCNSCWIIMKSGESHIIYRIRKSYNKVMAKNNLF
jgi:hypothetical protein